MIAPVRVLTVGNMYPPHSFGGYELAWRSSVQHLRRQGHEVRVLVTGTRTDTDVSDDPDVYRELRWHLRDGHFQELAVRERVRLAVHNHRTLRRHLDEFEPDVIAWWSMGGLTLSLVEAVRRRGIPAVAFVLDEWLNYGPDADPWWSLFRGRRRRFLAPLGELTGVPARIRLGDAATYLFTSDFTRRRAISNGMSIPRSGVAPCGIDPAYLDAAPERPWAWKLLYVGRLDPRKGVQTVIEALAYLPEGARLEIIGGWDSREEARLRALAAASGAGDRVVFGGHVGRDEIAAAYGRSDVVVFPVIWDEPWGLVPLEAMGRGRPVVATGRGGSAEYLEHERNCLLFEAEDPAGLAATIRRLADDPELRERLRRGGFETAPRHTDQVLNEAGERALAEEANAV